MYQVYADNELIYDSTLEDYKIGHGEITKEVDKSGSFVFSLYPDHPYYDRFVKLKTVVTVKKSGKIVFRGRVLNDTTDYWNKGEFTCEGELGFLQDSIVRPFEFQGTPEQLFRKFIEEHNAQVDEFKRFKIGTVTVVDTNDYINRSTSDYPTTLGILESALIGTSLGGHLYITHGAYGMDPTPTIHYVADFPKTSAQGIEFGVNLRDFLKTDSAEELATAVIPLGVQNDSGGGRVTIASANNGVDYLYNAEAVAARGWVFKTVVWDDVNIPNNLMKKGQEWLDSAVNSAVTVEMNAMDLHLLDRNIESYGVCEYVPATSAPHGFKAVMLCSKQTMNLLNPENDTVTLGYHSASFTDTTSSTAASVSMLGKKVSSITQDAEQIKLSVLDLEKNTEAALTQTATELRSELKAQGDGITADISDLTDSLGLFGGVIEKLEGRITEAESSISQTATQIRTDLSAEITDLSGMVTNLQSSITQTAAEIRTEVSSKFTQADGRISELQSTITQTAKEIRLSVADVADEDGRVTPASIALQIKDDRSLIEMIAHEVDFDASHIDFTAGDIEFFSKDARSDWGYDTRSICIGDGRISFRNNDTSGIVGTDTAMWFEPADNMNTFIHTVQNGGYSLSVRDGITMATTDHQETSPGIRLYSGHYVYIYPTQDGTANQDRCYVFTHTGIRFYYRNANGEMVYQSVFTAPA